MEEMVTCPTCDGTCRIHSHNDKCYDCKQGKVTRSKAEHLIEQEKQIAEMIPCRTWEYQ